LRVLFSALAQERALLLIIEDLHWVDSLSLSFLDDLVQNPPSHRFMLLAVHRTDFQTEWTKSEETVRLLLQPLDVYQSLRLVGALLDEADLPGEIKDLILSRSEGNPFFVEEVIRSLIEMGALASSPQGWKAARTVTEMDVPVSLRQVIAARIDHLGESPKLALRCASVLGRRFLVRVLERLGRGRPALDDDLTRLEYGEFVVQEEMTADLGYVFKHELIREVAYEGMLHRRRRGLHQQAAEAIESLFPDSIHEYYEQLAHHYGEAENPQKALTYLLKAAQKSQALYANADAVEYYKRSLRMFERLTPEEAAERAGERIDIDEGLGDIQNLLGNLEDAMTYFSEGVALAQRSPNDADSVARSADLMRKQAIIYEQQGDLERTRQTLGGALKALEAYPERHKELSRIHRMQARLAYIQSDYGKAEDEARRAVSHAETSGGIAERAEAINALGSILFVRVRYEDAIEQLQTAADLSQSVGDLKTAASALHNLGLIHEELGEYPAAKDAYEDSLRIMERIENRFGIASNLLHLGNMSKFMGDIPQAEEQMLCSLEIWRQMGIPSLEGDVLEQLGHLYLDTGRYDESERAYLQSQTIRADLEEKSFIAVCLNRRGELAIHRADFAAARSLLREALTLREEIGDDVGLLSSWNYLALLHLLEGKLDDAKRFAARMRDAAQAMENEIKEAWSLCRLGQIALVEGDREAAAGYFSDAQSLMRDKQNVLERVDILCELASANLAMGKFREAEEQAREALRLGEKMTRPAGCALARRTLGGALWDRGEKIDSREHFTEALKAFKRLGLPLEAARTQWEWGIREWEESGSDFALDLIGKARESFLNAGAGGDFQRLERWEKERMGSHDLPIP
jgi:tetratricopeptide (TPR) repeat protein